MGSQAEAERPSTRMGLGAQEVFCIPVNFHCGRTDNATGTSLEPGAAT